MTRTIPRLSLLAAALAVTVAFVPAVAAQELPDRINDEEFWRIISDFSEPGGSFRSDNFVSNEMNFQYVIPELLMKTQPGGAYIGVGPDQNFTYISELQPGIAFIVDIRRQNMLQHLLYKALIELSADRSEFFSRLFSRNRVDVPETATAAELILAYHDVPSNAELFEENLRTVKDHLLNRRGFELSQTDLNAIEYVFEAFYYGGPDISYSFSLSGRGSGRGMPAYWELMVATDGEGQHRSYLASEKNFQYLKQLQERNLVIPLIGDFAGPKALLSVAHYLRERNATVSVFYTSNVEQYLFQQGASWSRFYFNVAALPLDSTSTFIRAVFDSAFVQFPVQGTLRTASLLCSMQELLTAFRAAQIRSYHDVIYMSQ